MKTNLFLTSLLAGITTLATLAAEDRQPQRSPVDGFPFWSTKEQASASQFVPGLNAVLRLTEAQKLQLGKARAEMAGDPRLKEYRVVAKSGPEADEQRERVRPVMEAIMTRLRERVAAVLTPEQTALIATVNSAYASTQEEVGTAYEARMASVNDDRAARQRLYREKIKETEDQFRHKLDALLTPDQKQAMARAAEDEQRQTASATAGRKPAKP